MNTQHRAVYDCFLFCWLLTLTAVTIVEPQHVESSDNLAAVSTLPKLSEESEESESGAADESEANDVRNRSDYHLLAVLVLVGSVPLRH